LLDVKVKLIILLISKPGKYDLVPIGREFGCDLKSGKGCKGRNGQDAGLRVTLPDGTSLVLTGVTKTTYDGLGNLRSLDASGVNGNVPTGWRTGSGSYTVNPDCTGTETISFPGQPDIHTQFVVAQSGNKLHYVNIDAGISLSGEVERFNAPKCEERD